MSEKLTVGDVARLVGVSVRTLHHYESIGLLVPERTVKGYRLYTADDIEKLHTILVYRSLEFPLDKIQQILASNQPPVEELMRQRDLLHEKAEHLQSVLSSVENMIEVHTMGKKMTATERAQASHAQYKDEAEARYGSTDAYKQSAARAAKFSEADWAQVTEATEAFEAACAQAMQDGVVPGSESANALAEQHRELMNTYFDCSYNQQVLIGLTYVSDPRFTAHYDERAEGLAAWINEAIRANAAEHGVDVKNVSWQ